MRESLVSSCFLWSLSQTDMQNKLHRFAVNRTETRKLAVLVSWVTPPPNTHTSTHWQQLCAVKIAAQIPLDDPRAIINGWAALWDNVRILTSVNSHDEPAAAPVGVGV